MKGGLKRSKEGLRELKTLECDPKTFCLRVSQIGKQLIVLLSQMLIGMCLTHVLSRIHSIGFHVRCNDAVTQTAFILLSLRI